MKLTTLRRLPIILLALTLTAGCQQTPKAKAAAAPAPAASSPSSAPAATAAKASPQSAIVNRPEELKYPALVYEPPAPDQYRVKLKSGPVAYVVPDRELPLVNIVVYVRTGSYLEVPGKEGLADLTGYLIARGGIRKVGEHEHHGAPSGLQPAEELEERLAFLAAQLGSGIGGSQGSVSLNLLSKDLDEGLTILRGVLSTPFFQTDKIALRKQQSLLGMKERNDEPASIEGREAGFLAYGENFWANRYPTAASFDSMTFADIEGFHRKWFHPANFIVAASGDFDRDTMIRKLEELFANWPYTGDSPPTPPGNTTFAEPGAYLVNKDVNQGRVSMMLPGITRDNPDYFSVIIMNDILGGGGFTSRIMNRVRSDEGLAYSAYSSFPGGIYYPLTFSAGYQSKSRTVAYAASIVMDEIKRIASEPVSDLELNTSKRGFIDRFPRNFATKAQIATQFAQDELTGRYAKDPEFWKKFRSRIDAVNKDEVLRVAKKYLTPDKFVILTVGAKEDILAGDPAHPIKLQDLAGGKLKELPLRDPLTMKPLPLGSEPKSATPPAQ